MSRTTRVSHYQKVHFVIFWIFWCKMKITEADALTIRMDCHPIHTNWWPHLYHPTIFTPDALPDTTIPIYPGLGEASNMLACIPGGLVAYLESWSQGVTGTKMFVWLDALADWCQPMSSFSSTYSSNKGHSSFTPARQCHNPSYGLILHAQCSVQMDSTVPSHALQVLTAFQDPTGPTYCIEYLNFVCTRNKHMYAWYAVIEEKNVIGKQIRGRSNFSVTILSEGRFGRRGGAVLTGNHMYSCDVKCNACLVCWIQLRIRLHVIHDVMACIANFASGIDQVLPWL